MREGDKHKSGSVALPESEYIYLKPDFGTYLVHSLSHDNKRTRKAIRYLSIARKSSAIFKVTNIHILHSVYLRFRSEYQSNGWDQNACQAQQVLQRRVMFGHTLWFSGKYLLLVRQHLIFLLTVLSVFLFSFIFFCKKKL